MDRKGIVSGAQRGRMTEQIKDEDGYSPLCLLWGGTAGSSVQERAGSISSKKPDYDKNKIIRRPADATLRNRKSKHKKWASIRERQYNPRAEIITILTWESQTVGCS